MNSYYNDLNKLSERLIDSNIINLILMLVKLVLDKEIHLYKGHLKFSELKNFCQSSFRKLPEAFHFVYYDEEGDELMMSSNIDSVNFKSLFLHQNSKAIKLFIRPNP